MGTFMVQPWFVLLPEMIKRTPKTIWWDVTVHNIPCIMCGGYILGPIFILTGILIVLFISILVVNTEVSIFMGLMETIIITVILLVIPLLHTTLFR